MSQRLSTMLSEITDPSLRERIQSEFDEATKNKKFGLVFERHMPEHIALPGVKVRRGLKVMVRGTDTVLTVVKVRAGIATTVLAHPTDDSPQESVDHPVADLVVAAEFGDPVYPGLTQVGAAEGPDTDAKAPSHIVINAENHHALQMLQWTHEESVDCIYIDPPYNTGNKTWKYNDNYVGEQDNFRHSKWLSFMEKRLVLARKLLKPTGVIVVAIDDNEHHRLRMLMDQIFGAQNFLANIAWQGGVKNDSRFGGGGVDYQVIYGRTAASLVNADIRWKDLKPGFETLMEAATKSWSDSDHDPAEATKLIRQWWKNNGAGFDPGMKTNNRIDSTGRLYQTSDLAAPEARPNRSRLVLTHPVTGGDCPVPANGWRAQDETLSTWIKEGRIEFGKDHTTTPRYRRYLDEVSTRVPANSFISERTAGSKHLSNVLGDRRFPFPKDHQVLMRWLRMVAPKDGVILDFFGGSGTTAEAVLRLNAEDGGTRQSILVTNNELSSKDDAHLRKAGHEPGSAEYEALGVFHHVTKPRIETVVTGIRQDGSKYSDGLPGRVAFFDLEYLDANVLADDMAFAAINPLLWMRAGAVGAPPTKPGNDPEYVHENYAVLRDMDSARGFRAAVDQPEITHAFAVTNSTSEFAKWNDGLPAHMHGARLYEHYLQTFTINTQDATR